MTWVHDQLYAAGGDHIPSTWDDFAQQTGVTAVLHLRPSMPQVFRGGPPQAFLWLDVADEDRANLEIRWLAGEFLRACLERGMRVLLHSSLGRHRTRWAYVAYCIRVGQKPEVVLRRAAERPWLAPYHTDVDQWEAFAALARGRVAESKARTRRRSG